MISSADLRRSAGATTASVSPLIHRMKAKNLIKSQSRRADAAAAAASESAAAAMSGSTSTTSSLDTVTARIVTYRHDPYSFKGILQTAVQVIERPTAKTTPTTEVPAPQPAMSSAGFALPVPASRARMSLPAQSQERNSGKLCREAMDLSLTEDGVSEVSSENGASHNLHVKKALFPETAATATAAAAGTPTDAGLTPDTAAAPLLSSSYSSPAMAAVAAPARPPSVIRYASVNFRFGSAWFIAPFKTSVGEMVVVEYPANSSLHMGLVSAITTVKPATFYSASNPNPDTLTEEEVSTLPRLLRHARSFDRDTKLELRSHDLRSLQSARELAESMGVPIRFHDAEWLLDLSAITFLVSVHCEDVELVNQLAEELATVEGAEVVFTYPAVGTRTF